MLVILDQAGTSTAKEIHDYAESNGIRVAYVRAPIAREAREGAKDTRGVEIGHGFAERTTFIVTPDGNPALLTCGVPVSGACSLGDVDAAEAVIVVAGFNHFRHGVQILIEDYTDGLTRHLAIVAMVCLSYGAMAVGLFALVRLAL